MWYIGIDAGGSNTRAVIANQEGTICSIGRSYSANWNTGGIDSANQSLLEAIEVAFNRIDVSHYEKDIYSVYIGTASLENKLTDTESKALFPLKNIPHVCYDTDVYTALVGALDQSFDQQLEQTYGSLLIAGTGTIAITVVDDKRFIGGGWGAYYGDSGSAYAIGRHAIKQALLYFDKLPDMSFLKNMKGTSRLDADQLFLDALIGYAGIRHTENHEEIRYELTKLLYQKDHVKWVAGFTQLLSSYIDKNQENQGIKKIFTDAGIILGKQMEHLLERVKVSHPHIDRLPVSFSGSVVLKNAYVRDSFISYLQNYNPTIKIAEAKFPQVIGALMLAFSQAANLKSNSELNLKSQLEKIKSLIHIINSEDWN